MRGAVEGGLQTYGRCLGIRTSRRAEKGLVRGRVNDQKMGGSLIELDKSTS